MALKKSFRGSKTFYVERDFLIDTDTGLFFSPLLTISPGSSIMGRLGDFCLYSMV